MLPNLVGPRGFAVQVAGDSMDKVLPEGSFAVVDPDKQELREGKFYLLQNSDHEVTIKCYKRNPARFIPMSTNEEHREFLVSEQHVVVLGQIVWGGSPL